MRHGFLEALRRADSESDVLVLMRDYVARWTPEELAALPPESRPSHLRDAEDVADTAMSLTRARISSFEPEPALSEMETFFAQGCVRLSQLEAAASRRRSSDRDFVSR